MLETTWYLSLLACPDCGSALSLKDRGWMCTCGYLADDANPLDLRPCHPLDRNLVVPLGTSASTLLQHCVIERPPITYLGPRSARDSRELFSSVLAHIRRGQSLLDLGCGPRDQAVATAYLGLRYVGVDYAAPSADVLADAHALPFQADSFDFVLSYAVLEHLYNRSWRSERSREY
jgi:SAM-dependent methyltransferase